MIPRRRASSRASPAAGCLLDLGPIRRRAHGQDPIRLPDPAQQSHQHPGSAEEGAVAAGADRSCCWHGVSLRTSAEDDGVSRVDRYNRSSCRSSSRDTVGGSRGRPAFADNPSVGACDVDVSWRPGRARAVWKTIETIGHRPRTASARDPLAGRRNHDQGPPRVAAPGAAWPGNQTLRGLRPAQQKCSLRHGEGTDAHAGHRR